MAIDIDGIAVLRAISAIPRIFPDAGTEINNFARKLVSGQLKPATTNLEWQREIYRAIGGEAFVLILDGQADTASAALVKKLDKYNPDTKTAPADWLRRRIVELASGVAEPARKPSKPTPSRPKASGKGKIPAPTPEQKELATGLEAKTINLADARDLWLETGEISFALVLGGLTETQTRDLAKRLDKDNPDLKTAAPDQLRQRISDLASGTAEPVFKNILESKAMAATRTKRPKAK